MDLTFVSCNIRFDNPADGDNAWPRRRHFLTNTLLKYDPDIIATQEGRQAQIQDLSNLLPGYQLVDFHRSWIKERMYPSFFIKQSRFELLKSEDLWLSNTPEIAGSRSFDSAFPRLMTWMKVQPINSIQKILLVNTHLDHIRPETRACQARVLLQEIKKIWSSESSIILMGDFNEGPEGEVRRIVLQEIPNIQDSWRLFYSQEETSHHAFQGEMQNGARIDWILVDSQLKVIDCQMDKTQESGRYPTDHFPIICKIRL